MSGSTFININKNDLAIADKMNVQGTITDIEKSMGNTITRYDPETTGSPGDNDFGLIIRMTNKTNPPNDRIIERLIAFSSDGHIYTKYRINDGPWSEWQMMPYMDEIDDNFIKNISITGKTVTITYGNGKTKSFTTQDTITRVKGNEETAYSTGDVNLTPAKIGAIPISGGTLSGALVGAPNTNYTTPQFRNITMSTSEPSGGSNGQVHFKYT